MLQEIEAVNSPPEAIVSLLLSIARQQIHLQQTRSSVKIAGSVKLTRFISISHTSFAENLLYN